MSETLASPTEPPAMGLPVEAPKSKYCLPLENIGLADIPKAGGKTASLGEMIQHLTKIGVKVPGGFGILSTAYDAVLDQCCLRERLELLLKDVDVTDLDDLHSRAYQARQMMLSAGLPRDVREDVLKFYQMMNNEEEETTSQHGTLLSKKDVSVAVRSSATAEDLPNASFAGQQATFLNERGGERVCQTVLECLASVFTDRAIAYRVHNGFNHMDIKGAVVVQRMVRSDLASSGVAFTLDPDTGFRDLVVITGSYGLGESVVGGKVDPDEIQVFKPMIGKVKDPIIRRKIGRKQTKIVYSRGTIDPTKQIDTPLADQKLRCFSDEDAKLLAQWCKDIEKHYSALHGHSTPMDIEWAKDGISGELYIVQARPETVRSRQSAGCLRQTHVSSQHGPVALKGTAIGSDAACGVVHVIRDLSEISTFQKDEILVADMTDPDWVPAIRIASAVVTNRGGRTCHAAIVSRELGVPCIVGTHNATEVLQTHQEYTIDCSKGSEGCVYEGLSEITVKEILLDELPQTKTEIKLILGDPDSALGHASLPVAGVGLTRQEFVVAAHIGIHPNAVLQMDVLSEQERQYILEKSINDSGDPVKFFIRQLSEGIGSIAAAFFPRPVLVRLGDFKSNEYCQLVGGKHFESIEEENPMIGLRGASRYIHPRFKDAFQLECQALSYVRNDMGLVNVQLMVPFCRTAQEGQQVLEILEENGLVKGKDGLELWCMCEIPSNVLAMDQFSQVFDGFSIGSNDLTQLVLGVDRDSGELAKLFNEQDVAVTRAIHMAIEGAHANGRSIGLCGQAPSDNPEFAKFLVDEGIDSISLMPDTVFKVLQIVSKAEEEKRKKAAQE